MSSAAAEHKLQQALGSSGRAGLKLLDLQSSVLQESRLGGSVRDAGESRLLQEENIRLAESLSKVERARDAEAVKVASSAEAHAREMRRMRAEHEAEAKRLGRQLGRLQAQVEQLSLESQSHEQRARCATEEKSRLAEGLRSAEARLAEARERSETTEAELAGLRRDLVAAQADCQHTTSRLREAQRRLEEEPQSTTADGAEDALLQLQQAQAELGEARREIVGWEGRWEAAKQEFQRERCDLQRQLHEAHTELRDIEQEVAVLREHQRTLDRDRNEAIRCHEKEVGDLKRDIAKERLERPPLSEYHRACRAYEEEINSLRAALQSARVDGEARRDLDAEWRERVAVAECKQATKDAAYERKIKELDDTRREAEEALRLEQQHHAVYSTTEANIAASHIRAENVALQDQLRRVSEEVVILRERLAEQRGAGLARGGSDSRRRIAAPRPVC
mmetsp:Transcript_93681/g.214286  ORF Transcript_93681/g.214286 Transcript_93681/m.214286 type:complete len:450 (-) Transcript_93681:234-1583(-)